MKDGLQPGLSVTKRITVTEARTIDFLGPDPRAIGSPCAAADVDSPDKGGRVYATPSLIRGTAGTSLSAEPGWRPSRNG